jgi:preprotein translocase subunit SecA
LRQAVGLRGYAQRDPLNEYKSDGFELFEAMISTLRREVISMLLRIEVTPENPPAPPVLEMPRQMVAQHFDPLTGENEMAGEPSGETATLLRTPQRNPAVDPNSPETWANTARNANCPCGSGRKFKHCHGALK